MSAFGRSSGIAGRFVGLLTAVLLTGCDLGSTARREATVVGGTMGTTFSVKIVDPPETLDLDAVSDEIDAALEAVNDQMSTWRPDSELSRLNRAPVGRPQAVGDELFGVLTTAAEVSEASGGAFDVTVGPLVNLWSFGPGGRPEAIPADEELAAAREAVGMRHIKLDPATKTVTRDHAGVAIDLSAIAKGYGVDRVCAVLERHGLPDYMVEVGGEVRCRGVNASGQPWRIGIEAPTPGERSLHSSVPIADAALATSGNYRNFFEHDGVSYGHTIDPATGWPVTHALVSASVVTDNCERADAFATALMAVGPDAGMELAEREDLGVLLLVRGADGRLTERASPAWPAPHFAAPPAP